MHWRCKGLIQKFLSVLPGGVWANDFLQRKWGGLRDFHSHVRMRVSDWCILAAHLPRLGLELESDCFEIGTGWVPILPICFSLAGARRCYTFDLHRHLDPRLTFQMLPILEQHLPAIATASRCPISSIAAAYQQLRSARNLDDLLRRARIEYSAPADAASTHLPTNSIDIVFSNCVMEHVPRHTIAQIMQESARILRPGGVSLHSVNCGDHYAYIDPTITQINYLTYPDRRWRFWNNHLLYQNRLRPSDFVNLAEQAGLLIAMNQYRANPQLLKTLPSMSIAPEFRRHPPEQLCSTSVTFAARKADPCFSTNSSLLRNLISATRV